MQARVPVGSSLKCWCGESPDLKKKKRRGRGSARTTSGRVLSSTTETLPGNGPSREAESYGAD